MKTPTTSALIVLAVASASLAQHGEGRPAMPPQEPLDWKTLEAPVLTRHVELTKREKFIKAGEAYFSPDARWIVFQAVPVPEEGRDPDPFYSMYVAKLTRDGNGRITGTEEPILISPPGSANTCGWFHPTEPWRVLFGSTLTPPSTDQRAGFQVGGRKYVWLFPQETEICTRTVRAIFEDESARRTREYDQEHGRTPHNPPALGADADAPLPLFSRPDYDAECSYSADGRFVLYAHVREDRKTDGRADADIWVYDTRTEKHHPLVTADGYDGGPFFSPDGKRICYRSDRKLDDRLQLFIADLKFDAEGAPVGIAREYQITDNEAVNWAPYWHPSGRFIVYGTSEVSHGNYEVFAVEVDDDKLRGERPAETLARTRITHALGADVLPVFSADGKTMMWTGQRGAMAAGEQRPSSQLWVADFDASGVRFGDRDGGIKESPQRR